MAGLMDMRELGMLRNATQRMERGGGIDMDEWRRRKAAEEQSVAEQAIAAARAHPAYQALKSGASGGPFAAGSIVRSLPFFRAGPAAVDMAKAAGRGASTAGKYLRSKLWSPGYPGAGRKGEMVFGRDSSGKLVPRIASKAGEWKHSGRPTKWGATVGEAATLGAAGAAYLASRDDEPELEETVAPTAESVTYPEVEYGEVTPFPGGHYTGVPMHDNPSSLKTIIDSPQRGRKPLPIQKIPQNNPVETPENTPNLWKTWGSLADDPKKRRDAYLGSIKNIYMKKMLLDSIAKLTGGKSQGDTWAQMAIAELDAIEKFDSEERIHQQWKALFFREDGTYDPPKNRKEAMERGHQLGYDADQLKDIMTVFPKETDKRTNIEKYEEYISSLPEGSAKRIALEKKYLGMHEDEKDDRTSYEKFIERMVDGGLISRGEGDKALIRKTKGTDSGLTAAQDNFKWYQGILERGDKEEIAVANKFLRIHGEKAADLQDFLRLYTSQTFQDSDSFSPGEKAKLEELIKKAIGLGIGNYKSREEAKSAIIAENPKPDNISNEEYERKIEEKVKEVYGE